MLDVESDATGEGAAQRVSSEIQVVLPVAHWVEVPADGAALWMGRRFAKAALGVAPQGQLGLGGGRRAQHDLIELLEDRPSQGDPGGDVVPVRK